MSETVGALVPTTGPTGELKNLPVELADLAERASQYAKLSKAPNTKRAYEADWRAFAEWCGGRDLSPCLRSREPSWPIWWTMLASWAPAPYSGS